jgi:virulence-associated protein VapD
MAANQNKCRKSINFDLDDSALKAAYPKPSYKRAWDDIKKFMVGNGFEHRLYSGYNSREPMLETEIYRLIDKMKQELSWLMKPDVIKEIDVTDIGETLSLKHLFSETEIE